MNGWQQRLRRDEVVIGLAALLALLLYVGVSALGQAGFPLDDAWIHQTYARNLARTGRWAFLPGQVSGGSTAPLWTLWLAIGYLLRLPHLLWAYLSGGACLVWLGLAGRSLYRHLWPEAGGGRWLGLALVFSWPLLWAAGSGMETLLFAALGLQLAAWYAGGDNAGRFSWPARLGAGGGLLILTRPDGLVLLLLLGLGLALGDRPVGGRPRRLLAFAAGALLILLPYFAFNRWASGQWWPNTFYAKQAEYAALLARPLWRRFVALLYFSVGGPPAGWRGMSQAGLLLLPGLVLAGWRALGADWRARRLRQTLPLWWAGGHVLLYAWRLPVTYQHGRYLLAALPVWLIFGWAGWRELLPWLTGRLGRLSRPVAQGTFAAILAVFFLLGLQAYLVDVTIINGEMVATARWLAANTPADSLVAAHDIGAIGYFAERPLLDLAGLVSPEVVPLLDDEAALADYVRGSDAAFLVTAPGWPYERLTADRSPLYTTDLALTREQGLNNMSVYRLR